MLMVVIAVALWFTKDYEEAYEIAETKNAEIKELRLVDGAFIQMNNATQIRYREIDSDSVRLVFLKGEAYFAVEKKEKPFIVQTENSRVRVLGTEFNIWSRKKETRVFVREGKVSLIITGDSGSQERAVINTNHLAIAKESQIEDITEIQESGRLLGWREGKIVFNRTELEEVAEELERIFNRKIRLEQEELGSLSITANFRKKPVEDILEATGVELALGTIFLVGTSMDLKYRTESNGFIIYQ